MTVEELISRLKHLDRTLPVYIFHIDDGWTEITEVENEIHPYGYMPACVELK